MKLNPTIEHLPTPWRIVKLPIAANGFYVPWFVSMVDGEPEFRVADGEKLRRAVEQKLCWVCGMELGTKMTFVIGPMCAVNRVSAEPPSHLACAEYSVRACPFLTRPAMERREGGLPQDTTSAGVMIERNPGVSLLWVARKYHVEAMEDGILFRLGEPLHVFPYAQGQPATAQQVRDAFDSGLPILEGMARAQPGAEAALAGMVATARTLLGISPGVGDGKDV